MPVYQLDAYHMGFPSPELANSDGLLAIGGALREDWILLAYENGIFPWFNQGQPIMWWSPDPRFVLRPDEVKIQKSMRPYLNNGDYKFKLDTDFDQVIDRCSAIPRKGQSGTWITTHMKEAYKALHQLGMAHSAEIWCQEKLLAGLYGVSLGSVFFGESMFTDFPNLSKLAFIKLCQWLDQRDFDLIDCQVYTTHLESLGAQMVSRSTFLEWLYDALEEPTFRGRWKI